jgi:hypothetical protein
MNAFGTNGTSEELSGTKALTINSSGTLNMVGIANFSGSTGGLIAQFSSTGAVLWQKSLTGNSTIFLSSATDSSGNVYVVGYSNSPSGGAGLDIIVIKYNSSGTLQWQRRLGNSGITNILRDCSLDSSGNLYVVGYSGANWMAAKYNTSGVIQWQRSIGFSGVSKTGQANSVLVDGTSYYMGGLTNAETPASNGIFITRLPTDGTYTGTYTVNGYSVTYAVSTLTETALTFTSGASSVTDGTGALTGGTSSMTSGTSTFTSSVTSVP